MRILKKFEKHVSILYKGILNKHTHNSSTHTNTEKTHKCKFIQPCIFIYKDSYKYIEDDVFNK